MPIDLPCSGCRRRLSIREEFANRQVRCPACGAMVLAAPPPPPPSAPLLPGYAGPFFAPPAPPAPPPTELEWEDTCRPPRLAALFHAWGTVLLSPGRFFSRAPSKGSVGRAAAAGLPFFVLGALSSALQASLLSGWVSSSGLARIGHALRSSPLVSGGAFRIQLLFEAAGLVLFPLALHLCVASVGGRGIACTYRIYFYSLVARVFDLLPLGMAVSCVYLLVLLYLGLRHLHGLSEAQSLGVLLLALFVSVILLAGIMLVATTQFSVPGR